MAPAMMLPGGRLPVLTAVKRTEDKAAKPAAGALDLKALMGVKLKKNQPNETQQPLEKVASLVSLEALQGVKLKKVQEGAKENQSPENILMQQQQQQPQFLLKLKKSGADRSPGGTPYRQAPVESTGDGFTPMLSNALKKKFKQANGALSPQRTPPQQKQALKDISGSPFTPIGSPLRGH